MRTIEYWRTVYVHNSYNLVTLYANETREIGVYLSQSANDGQRMNMGVPTGYTVIRPGFYTDPTNLSRMRSNKVFDTFSQKGDTAERWAATLEAAATWTADRYSVGPEFVSIPGFGRDRFPQQIADWAKVRLREIKKAS